MLIPLSALIFLSCTIQSERVHIYFDKKNPTQFFAATELKTALNKNGFQIVLSELSEYPDSQAQIHMILTPVNQKHIIAQFEKEGGKPFENLKMEGFTLRKTSAENLNSYWVIGAEDAGTLYGALELAEIIRCDGLEAFRAVSQNPYMPLRGIKFNCPLDERTPTYHNHDGDAQINNVLVMWDMAFWKAYIDDLARYRYNYLSLWNLHPFPSMVRVPGYEKVALDDVKSVRETLKMSIEEKITFWRKVMRYAKERNVAVYVITWNIFTHGTRGQYGLTDQYDNPMTTDYFRKSIKQMFMTYPDLAGMGLTTGENMKGMTTVQKEAWAFATYGLGILDAATSLPGRKIRLIHRQHQTGARDIARIFKPLIDHPDIDFIFSYKYAKAHAMSSTVQPFCNSFVEDIGSLRTIWTLRNDSNYYFRWGAADFVREFLQNIPYEPSQGYYYGSDGYIWGQEFLSTVPETPRQYEMDKHWYHWMLWGRLGYNPDLTNDRLIKILEVRFPQVNAKDLFTAWQNASMVYPVTTGFHWGDLDFRWYIEGCICHPRASTTISGFHDINRFITLGTHPGTKNIAIPEYVEAVTEGRQTDGITPIEVSQQLHTYADEALQILSRFPAVVDKELKRTLGDIGAMAMLGKYYGHKIRGATELAFYRKNKNRIHQVAAVQEMTQAANYWEQYVTKTKSQYRTPIQLNRVGIVDLDAVTKEVHRDIEIAGMDE
ncbi:hypothetical protein BVY01_02210 [bacterium I07]|nr:hypothetical protein BVY01_02210 [bacterium I07]